MEEDELIRMLKERGLEKPSAQFSNHLTKLVVQRYKKSQAVEYTAGSWLGKFILSVLVFFNLLLFYYLKPFSVQPVFFISITAFVLGVWAVIALIKKNSNNIPYLEEPNMK